MGRGRGRRTMEVLIMGAGGHGRVVLDILRQAKTYRPIAFVDNDARLHGRHIDGLPVLGDVSQLGDLRRRGLCRAVVAVGDNGVRRSMAEAMRGHGFEPINAIHPSAQIAQSVVMGKGVVIAAGALVCAHCQIGDYAILNTGCIVDHESSVGTCAHVCPGVRLAGRAIVEAGAIVGIGATVIQRVRIGLDAIVGAGAVVIEDVDPMTTVVGVPARVVKGAPALQFDGMPAPAASNDPRDPMHAPRR